MMFGQGTTSICPWCGAGYSTTDTVLLVFFGLLALAGIVVLIVWLVRGTARGGAPDTGQPRHEDAAIRIARERLARGEISQSEYEQLVRTLGSQE